MMSNPRLCLTLAAMFLIACKGNDKTSSTSGAPGTGASAAAPSTSAADTTTLGPGRSVSDTAIPPRNGVKAAGLASARLPKPIAYYSSNSQARNAELYSFIMNHRWNGHERDRKCYPQGSCSGKTKMVIEEVEGADKLKFTSSIPAGQWILVGRMENTGDKEDIVYHDELPPHQNAQGFVFLEGGTDGKVYPVLSVFKFQGNVTLRTDYYGRNPMVPCDSTHTDGFEADFKPCPNDNPSLSAEDKRRIQDASISGAWFSCQEGCCGSSYPPVFELKASASPAAAKKP